MSFSAAPRVAPETHAPAVPGAVHLLTAGALGNAMDTNPALSWALSYINIGWHVLPLKQGTKQPAAWLVRNGVHGATIDPEQARKWWTASPDCGVGVAIKPSGLVCVDVDPRNGGFDTMDALEAKHGPLVSDVLQFTGGGGEHRIFSAALVENLPGTLGKGVDLKADGYFCAEPTIHPNGRPYDWEASSNPMEGALPSTLPGWVRDLGRGPFGVAPFIPAVRMVDAQQVADLEAALACIPANDYHQWVNFGNALSELGQAGFVLWDTWSQKSDKYTPAGATAKWRSFKPGAIQLESIFFEAQRIGWANPAKVDPPVADVPAAPAVEADVAMLQDMEARAQSFADEQDAAMLCPPEFLALPGPMGECMRWMLDTAQRKQPLLAMAATLSLFSTVLSTKVCSPTRLRTNLYIVSVAGTSAGKDHGRKCVARVLQAAQLENLLGGEELASGAGLLARAAACPRTVFQLDEFGLMLQAMRSKNAGSHLASIVRYLMTLFGSTDSIYRGAEYADQKMRARQDIEYPCINLHATTTPDQFFQALGSADVTSGALNRMLVLVTPDKIVPRQEPVYQDPPESVVRWVEAVQRIHCDMMGLTPASPIVMPYTREARDLVQAFDAWLDQRNAEKAHLPQVTALWGRAFETSVKLAMLHAMALHADPAKLDQVATNGGLSIGGASMGWGIAFAKHFTTAMENELMSRMADGEFGLLVQLVIKAINKAGPRGLTVRELGRVCAAYKDKEPRYQDSIHLAVMRREEAVQVSFPPPSGRGKPRLAWVATDHLPKGSEEGSTSTTAMVVND